MIIDLNGPASLEEIRKRITDLKTELTTAARDMFNTASKQLFANNPELKSFSWTQYTPYFNDGDVCEFSVHRDYPYIQYGNEAIRSEFYFSDYDYDYSTHSRVQKTPEDVEAMRPKNNAYEAVKDFLDTFTDDEFNLMFGDHAEIIVTPTGLTVDNDYGHD